MGVEFEDSAQSGATIINEVRSHRIIGELERPKMVGLIMKMGIIKNDQTAYYILLSLSILAIVSAIGIALYFFNAFGLKEVKYDLPPEIINALPPSAQRKINAANAKK